MEVLVTQSCLTRCDLMVCSLPGSSVHGILQARILEWVSIPFSREWGYDSYAALWFASSNVVTPLLFFFFFNMCVYTLPCFLIVSLIYIYFVFGYATRHARSNLWPLHWKYRFLTTGRTAREFPLLSGFKCTWLSVN